MSKLNAPVALIIMDGWGVGDAQSTTNAVNVGKTPVIDGLTAKYPHAQLACSGEAVGLPDGQMGNSEVGHTNIGAGRIVYQELTRITKAIREGAFFKNPVFLDIINAVKKNNGALHLMGLLSDVAFIAIIVIFMHSYSLQNKKALKTFSFMLSLMDVMYHHLVLLII